MNQDNNNTLAENPNSDQDDFGVFDRLDKKSFAGNYLKEGVKAIGNGIKTGGKALQEGADAIGREVLEKNASKEKKRVVGYGIEGAGIAGLAWLASKMFKSSDSSEKKGMSTGTKLLIGAGILGGGIYAFSKMDISKLNLLGGLGNQLSEMNKKVEQATADFEKAQQNLMIASQEAKNAVINGASEAVQVSKNTAEEAAKKIMEEAQAKKEEAETLRQQTVQQRIMEGKTKIQKLEEELQNAKQQIPQNPIIIAKLESEIKAWQEGVAIMEKTMVSAPTDVPSVATAIEKTSEMPKEIEMYWRDILSICEKNGIITSEEKNTISSTEEFKKFMAEQFYNKEMMQMVGSSFGQIDQQTKMIVTGVLVMLMFLAKGILRKFLQGGIAFSIFNIASEDQRKLIRDKDKYLKTIEDIQYFLDKKFTEKGYKQVEQYAWFESIFGAETMMFINSRFTLTPEFCNTNKQGFTDIQTEISKLPSSQEKEESIKHFQEFILLLNTPGEKVSQQDLIELFLQLSFLGIHPKIHKTAKMGYSVECVINGKTIKIGGLPMNPFPDILSEEDRAEKYQEKEKDLLSNFEKEFNAFKNVFLLERPDLLSRAKTKNSDIEKKLENLLTIIQAELQKEGISSRFTENTVLPLLREIETAGLGTITIESGCIFFQDPANKNILLGFTKDFKKEENDPRYISSMTQDEMEDRMFDHYEKLGLNSKNKVRENMKSIYLKLPENSPLKKHISVYLSNKTESIDEQIFYDTAWWGEFFYMVAEDPTIGAWGKIESGIFSIAGPWGEFALTSMVDPIFAAFDSNASWKEVFTRSFLGTGLLLGTAGIAVGSITGNGILGKTGKMISLGGKGFLTGGIRWNPVTRPFWEIGKFGLKAASTTGSWQDVASSYGRQIAHGDFIPNSLHALRNKFGGDPSRFIFDKYVNLLKEEALFTSNQGTQRGFIAGKFTDQITNSKDKIKTLFESLYGSTNSRWNEFDKAAIKIMNDQTLKYEDVIKDAFPEQHYKTVLNTALRKGYGRPIDINTAFRDIRSNLQTDINRSTGNNTLHRNLKLLFQSSYADEVYTTIKRYSPILAPEIKTALENIKTAIGADPELKSIVNTIDQSIKDIDNRKAPKLLLGKINPLRSGLGSWASNSRIMPKIGEVRNMAKGVGSNTIKGIGWVGGGVDVGINGIKGIDNIIDATKTEEGQGETYLWEGGLNFAFGGAKGVLAFGSSTGIGTVPSIAAYSLVSGIEGTVMGGFKAQHQADWSPDQFQKQWGKEKLLHEIAFMATTNMDDAVKNTFHDLPWGDGDIDKGKTKEEIRRTVWEAMGLLEMKDSEFWDTSAGRFYDAYIDCIQLKTEDFKKTDFTVFDIQNLHVKAVEYAKKMAEVHEKVREANATPASYQRNEKLISKIFTNNTPLESTEKSLEKLPPLSKLEEVIYQIATNLYKYSGPKTSKSLHDFFKDPKKGIYWDEPGLLHSASGGLMDEYTGWKIHRMESLVADEPLDKPNDEMNIAHLINYINAYPISIFHSEEYGVAEQTIDRGKEVLRNLGIINIEKDKNLQNMYDSSLQITKSMILSSVEKSGRKNEIMQASSSVFEKGIMIFSIANGYTGNLIMEDIKKKLSTEENNVSKGFILRWNPKSNKFIFFTSSISLPMEITDQEKFANISVLDNKLEDPATGEFRTLQQCMQIAKELSTTSPGTPSS